MHKPKKRNLQSPQKSVDWLEYINDCLPALVIPVGPRFQADVAEWVGPSNERYVNGDSDTSRWFGTKMWTPQDDSTDSGCKIGKGRLDSCTCSSPGSPYCVKQHVTEARARLQSELGPTFKSWKFDMMGEVVGKSWTSKQKKKFDHFVKANPLSQGKSFLQPAMSSFPSKTRKDIVNYYLNVYVPKRISLISRSGCKVLDSDDDEVVEAPNTPNAKNSLKRSRSDSDESAKLAKSHYLTGRR
ncbi:AT-rich interactive domain-containing protein 2 [Beta vulgaris subsp. vulgaris]|uniref:AT-rich interactive domain-containing protein 2 n=1 Tax=Beta vulgaris subsp. vulgaris TaxID=3555 RepID=UPI0020371C5F|nr:AT-rich interactive domain-containing protein 2 [Beta vulgaris subsp. vulgaris]XP_048503675.1 AT-rich interactive domain-containing protein 2 [Beta vulgaris subsp. vulgaris]